ncbi:MAG: LamG domain-containing protein, partial [bacterium]|nr:LamG domain-containing protein [bacterium]
HGTVGLIPVSTQISGNLAQYSAYANGGIMRENDYASINMNSIRNRSRRVFVHPSDPKRVIFLFSMPHRNTDRNAKTYALEVKDITSPVYNNALHNVTPNDRVFFRQSTTKQRLVQGVSSNGIPIATVFPLISRVGDFRRGQYKVRLRLLGAKVDNSPDENNIIATSIDEYDIADLPVRDTTNISGNFADYLPFSFLNKITITSGQIFYIEVFTDAPISAINYLAWASNNGNTLSGVGSWYYNGTNWTQPAGSQEASNSNDLCFFLCGEFVRIVSPADTLGVSNKTGIEINYINPVFCSTEDPNTAEVSFRRVIRVDANAVHGGVSYKREISFNTTSTACFNIGSDIKMLSYKDDDTEENLIFNVAFGHPDCAAKNRLTSFLTGKYNLDRSTMCNYVINDNTVASDYITDSSSPTGYCVVLSGGKNIRYSRPHNSGDQRGWAGRIAGHNGTNILYGFDHLIEMSVYVNNPTSGSIQALYGFGHDGTNGGFLLLIEPTGRLRIHLDGQGFSSAVWFETSATFPAAQWVKVKFYYKSETRSFELYINDILQTSFATSNTPTTYTTLGNRISVGASGGGSFPLTGRIAYIKHKVGQIPNANSFKYNGWKKHEAEAITIPMVNRKYLQLTYDSEAGGNQFQSFRRRSTIAQIENKSLTTSYSILARYENLNLAQEGQEMSVQIEMNRQSINQNNSIQGIAVEFSPET